MHIQQFSDWCLISHARMILYYDTKPNVNDARNNTELSTLVDVFSRVEMKFYFYNKDKTQNTTVVLVVGLRCSLRNETRSRETNKTTQQ